MIGVVVYKKRMILYFIDSYLRNMFSIDIHMNVDIIVDKLLVI
jgi:hypothetical protein